jgi:hypothetical protein
MLSTLCEVPGSETSGSSSAIADAAINLMGFLIKRNIDGMGI